MLCGMRFARALRSSARLKSSGPECAIAHLSLILDIVRKLFPRVAISAGCCQSKESPELQSLGNESFITHRRAFSLHETEREGLHLGISSRTCFSVVGPGVSTSK